MDRWLCFDPVLERHHDAENDSARVAHLREAFYVGLALFNVHNLTNTFLMPDVLSIAVAGRLIVVTPIVLVAVRCMDRMSAKICERVALCLVASAFMIEVILLWATQAQLGAYAFSEFGLTLVYGNMLLALRFRHAILFTALSFSFAVFVVYCKPLLDEGLRFAIVVQITMACIISLYANYKTERRRCSDYVVAYLAVARAAESESARRQFRDQSITDALTGLPNRRLLDERLNEWAADDRSLAVMMLDLDYFKLFNDTMGHPAGDDCLRSIGDVLAATQAPDLLCARFGGEEFTIAVRNADEKGAACLANALVRSIEALGIAHLARPDGLDVMTASISVVFKSKGRSVVPKHIVAAADAALYRAKSEGRNRYIVSNLDDLISAPAAA